jgi:transposase-like protein
MRGEKTKKRGRSKEDWVGVMKARDRSTSTYEAVLSSLNLAELNRILAGKIEEDVVLCSDGFKAYIQLAAINKMEHKQHNVSAGLRVIDNVFYIQNVNSYRQRFKNWIKRFHGVTRKYLEYYLGLFRCLDTVNTPNENSFFEVQQHLTRT